MDLIAAIAALRRHHGDVPPPPTRDPFALVVWTCCAYLVDDARRAETFASLKKSIAPRAPMEGDLRRDEILLLCGARSTLAPDSNALRVLVRFGFGEERRDYGVMDRLTTEHANRALDEKSVEDFLSARQLLRRHGQELCRRNEPDCPACPLRKSCPSAS